MARVENIFDIKYEYSDKELELIRHFGFEDCYERLSVPDIYRMMVQVAFLRKEDTPYTDSLRRTYNAFIEGKLKRLTPEWDALIVI